MKKNRIFRRSSDLHQFLERHDSGKIPLQKAEKLKVNGPGKHVQNQKEKNWKKIKKS